MEPLNETYEDGGEQIDLKTLSYEVIFLEGIRETMKLFREDWRNSISQKNKLIDALNSLDALASPLHDDEYKAERANHLEDPKGYFQLLVHQLYKKNALGRKKVDVI